MMLLTKAILKKMPKLYETEAIPTNEKEIIVKFFTPWTSWTWYIVEGEERDGDFLMFGYVDGAEKEWGYVSMNELKSVVGPFGLKIERDMYFGNKTIADVAKETSAIQNFDMNYIYKDTVEVPNKLS